MYKTMKCHACNKDINKITVLSKGVVGYCDCGSTCIDGTVTMTELSAIIDAEEKEGK